MKNFSKCLPLLLKDEGGYSNTPGDNGGPTNFGITLTDYRKYINVKGTAKDVRNMSVDQAEVIYRQKYWDALGCDNLPAGVDYTCFDYGVNSGLGRPRKALQRFKSLSGTELIDAINNERVSFLKAIGVGHNAKFLKGWLSRVERVRAFSKKLSKDNISGPSTTGTIATGTIGLSQYFHEHMYLILGGGLAAAILIGLLVHYLRNRK